MFLAHGALFGTWASRIPDVKDRVGAGDARMGVAFLALGAGSIAGQPLAGLALGRQGSDRVTRACAIAVLALLPVAGAVRSLPALVLLLIPIGAALGGMDVAMNAQGVLVERAAGRSLLSSLHALWSVGTLAGGAAGAAFAARGCPPPLHFVIVCAALGLLAIASSMRLIRDRGHGPAGSAFAWPSAGIVRVGLVAACAAIIEGGIADWSGLYLRDSLGASAGFAATGFTAFSLAMVMGRFAGDRAIDRFGGARVVRAGSVLATAAIAIALGLAHRAVAVVAFLLAGLGVCTIFPIAFGVAGRARGGSSGQSLAAVATMGYSAGLVGPAAIGFVAGGSSLRVALSLLVLAGAVSAALAGHLGEVPGEPGEPRRSLAQ
jgi:fucose permease